MITFKRCLDRIMLDLNHKLATAVKQNEDTEELVQLRNLLRYVYPELEDSNRMD